MVLNDSEIIDMYERVLTDYGGGKVERGDIIVMWSITALSKLSIRLSSWASMKSRTLDILQKYKGHANIEI